MARPLFAKRIRRENKPFERRAVLEPFRMNIVVYAQQKNEFAGLGSLGLHQFLSHGSSR
jgi:hypothetical protein